MKKVSSKPVKLKKTLSVTFSNVIRNNICRPKTEIFQVF